MGRGELQEAESPGTDDRLRTALHPEFATEVIDVPLDRVHTQDEALSDLAVGGTFKEQPQHLALGQRFHKWTGASRGEREISFLSRVGFFGGSRLRRTLIRRGEGGGDEWSGPLWSPA